MACGIPYGISSCGTAVRRVILVMAAAALLTVFGGGPARAQAACGSSASCGSSEHTVTFQNNCDYPVWIANAANVVGGSVIGGKTCSQTSDCCVTLPDGTQDCAGVNCANGTCSQINCTKNSDCPSPSSGLVSCNVPLGVQCTSDANCAAISCASNSDCPPGATCNTQGNYCQNICQNNVCACSSAGPACPGAGTMCDLKGTTGFGFCAGGACQYNGLIPENGTGTTSPQWELAATCASNSQCAQGQTCKGGQCTCKSSTDCAAGGGTCSGGLCVGQAATICMPAGWGGRFWGRTGCSTVNGAFQCQTGQCGSGPSGVLECTNLPAGVTQTATGATLFEGTWDSNSVDFWDLSLVNGYNIPMQISACAAKGAASCTFAGGSFSAFPAGCTSDLNASCPTPLQIAGQCNCVVDGDCPQGQTCGANNLCSGAGSCTVVCIDPGDLCTRFGLFANSPVIAPPASLQCNNAVSSLNATTYNDYYSCVGPLSGVSCNNGAVTCFADNDCPYSGQTCKNNVCWPVNALDNMARCVNGACNSGVNMIADYSCQTVQGTSLCLPNAPTAATESGCCGAYNSGWLTAAQAANGTPGGTTFAEVFRTACPLSYSFQFDDVASSFQCSDKSGETNYLVTFCPVATQSTAKKAPLKRSL